ncbi:MAG: M48 family metalloprotease [Acidobacteriota bacterium]|nr:M48 family metalloprotease [Acidobacteriota bacterium]
MSSRLTVLFVGHKSSSTTVPVVNEGRAARYHRLRRRVRVLTWVLVVVCLLWFVGSGVSVALSEVVTRLVSGTGRPSLPLGVLSATVYVIAVWICLEIVLLPLRWFEDHVLEWRYGRVEERVGRWVVGHVASVGLSSLVVGVAGAVVYSSIRLWPEWWWGVSGGVFAAATLILTNLAPVWVIPRFATVRPLARHALHDRVTALARRVGIPGLRVEECASWSVQTRPHATLVGLGSTRRILVSDRLLADYSDDEIEVMLAHELGHHLHRDVWWWIGFELSVGITALAFGGHMVEQVGRMFGVSDLAELAGLPLLALAAGGVVLVAVPFGRALSRRHERRADRFALRATRNPDAFVSGLRRLGAENLVEERPSRLVELLWCTHPPLANRLATAQRPGAVEVASG